MLFDRARLRAWFARKDPIDVALELVAELRVDLRVLQRRLAEVPEIAASHEASNPRRSRTRSLNGKSPARRGGSKRPSGLHKGAKAS